MKVKPALILSMCAALLMLAACEGRSGSNKSPASSTTDPAIAKRMNEPQLLHRDDTFELRMSLPKTRVKADEPVSCSVTLAYVGEQESITVYGPHTNVIFDITDGRGFRMEGASTAELARTVFKKGESRPYPFFKSGGFSESDPNAAFWKRFYAEKELRLPPGTYLISASTNFSLTEAVVDSTYAAKVYASVTVE